MDDVQQMIVNEVKRLERVIDKRTKALAQLDEKIQKRTSPRRYVLEFPVPAETAAVATAATNQPVTRSFVVDKDRARFFCQDVVFSVSAVGTVIGSSSNKATLSPEFNLLDFTWRIRDTSTDREWQNTPLPRYFMASGLTTGLNMPWPAPLRPGAEIETTIVPTLVSASALTAGFSNLTSYTVQVSFVGFEVL